MITTANLEYKFDQRGKLRVKVDDEWILSTRRESDILKAWVREFNYSYSNRVKSTAKAREKAVAPFIASGEWKRKAPADAASTAIDTSFVANATWGGGDMPVNDYSVVAVQFRNNIVVDNKIAMDLDWSHNNEFSDIVGYFETWKGRA
jgi:hypothetical protein